MNHPVGGGVTPHSEIIVGDELPCIFLTTLLQKGVTPHSEIKVGDGPPCIFWSTLLQKGGHTPFWSHSGRWKNLVFFNHPEIIEGDDPLCL